MADNTNNKSVPQKAKSYLIDLYNQGKEALSPMDNEATGINANAKNVDQYKRSITPIMDKEPESSGTPAKNDLIDPNHSYHYGDRPGEKAIDTREMRKPLGQAAPLYDEGGEVEPKDTNDGKHQVAVLEDGERVLTPEETKEYDSEHGQGNPPQEVADLRTPIVPPQMNAEMVDYPKKPTPAQQAAEQKVENPGAQTVAPKGVPDQIVPKDMSQPQPSAEPDPKSVFQKQKEEAAQKGDLVKLGAAILGEQHTDAFGNARTNNGEVNVPGGFPGRPQGAGSPTMSLDGTQGKAPEANIDPKQAFKKKIADYKQAYQAALDEFTPEGQKRAAGIKEAMLNYMRENPYGSAGNHPGILGKIEHGLATVGNVAGLFAPVIEAAVPGSALNRAGQQMNAEELGKEASQEQLQESEAAKNQAAAKLGPPGAIEVKEVTQPDGSTQLVRVNKMQNTAEPVPGTAGNKVTDPTKQARQKIEQAQKSGDPAAVEQAQQELSQLDPAKANEYLHSSVVSALSQNGLIDPSNVSDPKAVKSAIDTALEKKLVTPTAVAGFNAWASEHPDTATQMLIAQTKGDYAERRALDKMYTGKTVTVENPDGTSEQMTSAQAKAKGIPYDGQNIVSAGQAKKNEDEVANAMDVKRAMVNYYDDLQKYGGDKLTDGDKDALEVLTKNEGKISGELAGIVGEIPLIGPISEATNKKMQSFMNKNGYENMSTGGKKLMADYFSAVVANFQDTKRRLGGIGRNDSMILAEMHTIPMPYLDKESATEALDQRLTSLDQRNKFLARVKGEHPNDIKPKSTEQAPTPKPTTKAAPKAAPKQGDKKTFQGHGYTYDSNLGKYVRDKVTPAK